MPTNIGIAITAVEGLKHGPRVIWLRRKILEDNHE
jgi:hypothetical protein